MYLGVELTIPTGHGSSGARCRVRHSLRIKVLLNDLMSLFKDPTGFILANNYEI